MRVVRPPVRRWCGNTGGNCEGPEACSYEYHTDDGLAFYVSVDGATNTWVLPEGAVLTAAAAAAARYWQYETNDGRQFWVTEDGSESVWELPAGVTVIGAGEVASQGPVV